jgi:hypothetical protein
MQEPVTLPQVLVAPLHVALGAPAVGLATKPALQLAVQLPPEGVASHWPCTQAALLPAAGRATSLQPARDQAAMTSPTCSEYLLQLNMPHDWYV